MNASSSPDPNRNKALEHAMRRKHLTNGTLAKRLGVNVRTVRRWLAGETIPNEDMQYAIADVLGVDREFLF